MSPSKKQKLSNFNDDNCLLFYLVFMPRFGKRTESCQTSIMTIAYCSTWYLFYASVCKKNRKLSNFNDDNCLLFFSLLFYVSTRTKGLPNALRLATLLTVLLVIYFMPQLAQKEVYLTHSGLQHYLLF
jgi:hypothetical protein